MKSLLFFCASFFIVISATFFLMHAIPGDPFIGEQVLVKEIKESLYAYYGLDQPLSTQYVKYLKEIFSGNLGTSIVYPDRTVWSFIKEGFPASFQLGFQALLLAIPSGIAMGLFSALHQRKWPDYLSMSLSTLASSIPNFVLAALLQLLFGIALAWLPIARFTSFTHTILPTLTLAAFPTAFIARLVRSNMIETLHQDYIRTAIAKGLSPFQIAFRHGLKNSSLPLLAYLGPLTGHILVGSFAIERIFSIPGLGQWMIISIQGRDYPMILGLTTFFSFILITTTFLAERIYSFLDPRISLK